MDRRAVSVLASLAIMAGGCRATDRSFGSSTVTREYGKPVAESWDAAETAAKALDLRIESDRHDALGGSLVARRADDSRVTIDVEGVDANRSRIHVFVFPGNVDMARMTHERIADALGLGEASGGLFGGASLEMSYSRGLEPCLGAARATFIAMDFLTTHEESHHTWGRMDGRLADATPVRIRMEIAAAGEARVAFLAGTSKSQENRALVRKMKDEFERRLLPEARREPAPAPAPAPSPSP